MFLVTIGLDSMLGCQSNGYEVSDTILCCLTAAELVYPPGIEPLPSLARRAFYHRNVVLSNYSIQLRNTQFSSVVVHQSKFSVPGKSVILITLDRQSVPGKKSKFEHDAILVGTS